MYLLRDFIVHRVGGKPWVAVDADGLTATSKACPGNIKLDLTSLKILS